MRCSGVRRAALIALAAGWAISSASVAACHFVWNITASVPRGLYVRRPSLPAVPGTTVITPVPTAVRPLVTQRRYLPPDVVLMKRVVAGGGDQVCLDGGEYRVNGQLIGAIRTADSLGRRLEAFRFCGEVPVGQAFLATSAPLSFDSRYFGPVPLATLTVVTPLWTYSP